MCIIHDYMIEMTFEDLFRSFQLLWTKQIFLFTFFHLADAFIKKNDLNCIWGINLSGISVLSRTLTLVLLASLVIALTFHCILMPTDVKVQSNWLTFTYYLLGKVLWCIRALRPCAHVSASLHLCEIHKVTCIHTCVFVRNYILYAYKKWISSPLQNI